MSIRVLYILFMSVLHLALGGFAYLYLKDTPWAFILAEILLLGSIAIAAYLYSRITRPIRFVRSGIEAIKEKDFSIKFVPTGKGEIDTLIEVYNLMIDELRAERIRAHEQHYFLEKLIEIAPVAILIPDFEGRVVTANQKAQSLFSIRPGELLAGYTESPSRENLLKTLVDLAPDESRTVRTGDARTYRILRSQLMDRGFPRSFYMAQEITEELASSEKKAYGVVIRMMAHEINNTLGATNSILQSAVDILSTDQYRPLKNALSVGIDRNNRLVTFMRNFADVVRLPLPNRHPVEGGQFLSGIVQFFRPAALAKGIDLILTTPDSPLSLHFDALQMEQVLVNILKNALEACQSGHAIRIEPTRQALVVQNNGQPLSEEESLRLFTPFYTTKPQGQGIGLTITKEILQNHGFSFSLKTVGGWTQFEINWGGTMGYTHR